MTEGQRPIEVWRGIRKVTVYPDIVIRSWGVNIETDMLDEPTTLESVQAAFDWLYRVDGEEPCYD